MKKTSFTSALTTCICPLVLPKKPDLARYSSLKLAKWTERITEFRKNKRQCDLPDVKHQDVALHKITCPAKKGSQKDLQKDL